MCMQYFSIMSKNKNTQFKQLLNEIKQVAGKVPARAARRARRNAAARGLPQRSTLRSFRSLNLRDRYGGYTSINPTGMGDEVGAPVTLSRRMLTAKPRMVTKPGQSFRVKHRELVNASVAGSTSFTVQSTLAINPGLAATFPWLAPQAQQWEQYVCHQLHVIWVPIAPTSTAGDIMISPEYDSSEPEPTTETQLVDSADTVVDSCWNSLVCCLDPLAMKGFGPRRFVRACAIAGDIKTFDVAKVYIASNNETGTTAIGKLYIEYDFEFFKPQNSPLPYTYPQGTSFFGQTSNQTLTTTVATPVLFASVVYDPLNFGPASSGVFTPPAGCYRIEARIACVDSTTGEAFTGHLGIFKNGTLVTHTDSYSYFESYDIWNYTSGVVPCNGTDTISITATLTGSSGTLAVLGGLCTLLVSLA
jgi:hypothetical protein